MTNSPVIFDIVAVIIFILSALIGARRGFIKTVSGILTIVLAISISSFVAKSATPYISEKYVSPYIFSMIESKTKDFKSEDLTQNPTATNELFSSIGIPQDFISDAINDISNSVSNAITEPLQAITNAIAEKITYSIVFIITFLLSLLVLFLLFKLLNLTAKLPVLNFANKTLGLISGIISGYLIISVTSFILLKSGVLLTGNILSETFILKFLLPFSI